MADVLIVGAGPTGLVLALWLTRQGVAVRIVDKRAGPGETSRAMAVQARTLELYRQLDLADPVVAAGHQNPAMNLWARGRHKVRIALRDAGSGLSPHPYILIFPQDQHERLLEKRLAALGVTVERSTELLCFQDNNDRVLARLRQPDGTEQTCDARYLAACDGASSSVRRQLGISFDGGTYKQVFYVADVQIQGLDPIGEAHISLDDGDFLAVFPYGENGRRRLVGTVRDDRALRAESLNFDDVSQDAMRSLGMTVGEVAWFSTYRVHHRVAGEFRRGRTFLLGDAAHIHSPAGGQGMNTGILDAINLAWKLTDVLAGRAPDALLDTYGQERQAFARTLVETTDRAFTFITAQSSLANVVRTHIAPSIASVAYRIGGVRELIFRTVSQTRLAYRNSPLSDGKAGELAGGDRLPWLGKWGVDNYASLGHIGWQVHVHGSARPELHDWCARHAIALHLFDWQPGFESAGVARDALYLVRPDSYVALADPDASTDRLDDYFSARGYRLD